jgi:uncharacterized membrane protein
MAPCLNCGKDFPSEYINCPFCGHQRPVALYPFKTEPRPQSASGDSLSRVDWEVISNVEKLKWALALLALAVVANVVPDVGTDIAALLSIAGFIGLLIALHGLGSSALERAPLYGRTFWALILTLVVSILILIPAVSGLGGQFSQEISDGVTPASAIVSSLQGLLEMLAVVYVISAVGQIYLALSLKRLGQDLKEKRFGIAAIMYLVAVAVAFVSILAIIEEVSSQAFLAAVQSAIDGQTTLTQGSFFTGSYAWVTGITLVLGVGFYIAAAIFSYAGANRFLAGSGKLVTK